MEDCGREIFERALNLSERLASLRADRLRDSGTRVALLAEIQHDDLEEVSRWRGKLGDGPPCSV
jgi:hypothetical protein